MRRRRHGPSQNKVPKCLSTGSGAGSPNFDISPPHPHIASTARPTFPRRRPRLSLASYNPRFEARNRRTTRHFKIVGQVPTRTEHARAHSITGTWLDVVSRCLAWTALGSICLVVTFGFAFCPGMTSTVFVLLRGVSPVPSPVSTCRCLGHAVRGWDWAGCHALLSVRLGDWETSGQPCATVDLVPSDSTDISCGAVISPPLNIHVVVLPDTIYHKTSAKTICIRRERELDNYSIY